LLTIFKPPAKTLDGARKLIGGKLLEERDEFAEGLGFLERAVRDDFRVRAHGRSPVPSGASCANTHAGSITDVPAPGNDNRGRWERSPAEDRR